MAPTYCAPKDPRVVSAQTPQGGRGESALPELCLRATPLSLRVRIKGDDKKREIGGEKLIEQPENKGGEKKDVRLLTKEQISETEKMEKEKI